MSVIKSVFIFLVFLLMTSCHQQEMSQLSKVDELLDKGQFEHADMLLKNAEKESLNSEALKAYFSFLKLKSSFLCGKNHIDSTYLSPCIDYFWQNSKLALLSESLYYASGIEFKHEYYGLAFYYMKQAERFAKMSGDLKLQEKVQIALLRYNYIFNDYTHASLSLSRLKELVGENNAKKIKERVSQKNNKRNTDARVLCIIHKSQSNFDFLCEKANYKQALFNSLTATLMLLSVFFCVFRSFQIKKGVLVKRYEIEKCNVSLGYEKAMDELIKQQEHTISILSNQKGLALKKQIQKLSKGKLLYESIDNGETTATWNKANFEMYIDYYKLIDSTFVDEIYEDYEALSFQCVFYKILCHKGYCMKEIERILCKSNGALRTMKSRIEAKHKLGQS